MAIIVRRFIIPGRPEPKPPSKAAIWIGLALIALGIYSCAGKTSDPPKSTNQPVNVNVQPGNNPPVIDFKNAK